ncbi:unnamed protein product, partial [Ectocarpus sp. 12 AP-2014]
NGKREVNVFGTGSCCYRYQGGLSNAYSSDCRDRDFRSGRLFLERRVGLSTRPWCPGNGGRLHRRSQEEPDVPGGVLGIDGPYRSPPRQVRSACRQVQRALDRAVGQDRPDNSQPPRKRLRDSVPIRDLLHLPRTKGNRARVEGSGASEARQVSLRISTDRDGDQRSHGVLPCRGIPSKVPGEGRTVLVEGRHEQHTLLRLGLGGLVRP